MELRLYEMNLWIKSNDLVSSVLKTAGMVVMTRQYATPVGDKSR